MTVGRTVSGEVSAGGNARWRIPLAAGQAFRCFAVSPTAALTLTLEDAQHKGAAKASSLGGGGGKAILRWTAERAGEYTLLLTEDTKQTAPARFELTVEDHASSEEEAAIECGGTIAKGQALLGKRQYRAAIPLFEKAVGQAHAVGDTRLEGQALNRLALTDVYLENYPAAAQNYEQALALQRAANQPWEIALTLNNLAIAQSQLGNCRTAAKLLDEARTIREGFTDQVRLAYTWVAIANAQYCVGDLQETLDAYLRALALWRELKDAPNRMLNLTQVENNLGVAYQSVGEWDEARHWLDDALALRRQAKDRRGEGESLYNLGLLASAQGQPREALRLYEQALPILREAGYRQGEGYAISGMSEQHAKLGETAQALAEGQQAQTLLHELGNQYGEAYAWQDLGRAREATADLNSSRAAYQKALELERAVGDKTGETITLFALGKVEERAKNRAAAQEDVNAAAALVEESRAHMVDPGHRAAYLASERAIFEFQAAIAMRDGNFAAGLAASEAAHARSLLDEVAGGAGIDRKFIEEEEDLEEKLRKNPSPQLAARQAAVDEQIRQAHPAQAAFAYARPANLEQIRSVLDGDTALIEYLTGDDRSYVWAVTQTAIWGRELPSRGALEAMVRKLDGALTARNLHPAHENLSGRQKRLAQQDVLARQTAAELNRLLIEPLKARLGRKRLLIVPDGPLHLLPFALLPAAQAYAIASLPSASVLVEKRRAQTNTRAFRPLLIVAGGLPYALQEAKEIGRLVKSSEEEVKLGRAANRNLFERSDLARFGLIHIASHAVVDLDRPDNTGVELADGRLTARHVLGISITARLTTLSACQTAAGKPLAGEGLMGLTRSFLYAGSHMVLAALWQVDDQATAQFMNRFYRSLLHDGQSPAMALRTAQWQMQRDARWSNPYYWAAFTLQGDWK